MGLPIWRDPEEKKAGQETAKVDPTAHLRSSIRRRPSVHGGRPLRTRLRLAHDATVLPPRLERSPPPSDGFNGRRPLRTRSRLAYNDPVLPPRLERSPPLSGGFHGRHDSRHHDSNGVPPISTLLESADRPTPPPPPPPVPESRNYYEDASTLAARERSLRTSLTELQDRAERLERRTAALRADTLASSNEVERSRVTLAAELRTRMYEAQARLRAAEGRMRERMSDHSPDDRPHSRDGSTVRRTTLPTPPLEHSEDSQSLFLPEHLPRPPRSLHPLSRSWRPDSPVDGLGDRNRSPTPADGWEIMRTTITPDATLPSADSSFTSAAASQSFNSNHETAMTEPEPISSSDNSRRNSSDDSHGDSVSSVDPDDLVCIDEDDEMVATTEAFAEDMYYHEMRTPEGRERIVAQQDIRGIEGNRFALAHEPDRVDIGFRLIEDALESEAGRERVMQLQENAPENVRMFERAVEAGRRPGGASYPQRRAGTRQAETTESYAQPRAHPERYSDETRAAAREASEQVHNYFHRFTADALVGPSTSPPPGYPPPEVSRDEPEPYPVSPPSQRSEREISETLLSGDRTDLAAMRRVIETLARRDDVPDDWWTSIGLNLSRTRPRERSVTRGERVAAGDRIRTGRVERENPRL